jgi:hypothetical protein
VAKYLPERWVAWAEDVGQIAIDNRAQFPQSPYHKSTVPTVHSPHGFHYRHTTAQFCRQNNKSSNDNLLVRL